MVCQRSFLQIFDQAPGESQGCCPMKSGAASAAARQRSSVAAEMCRSCDTTSTGALSGGSSLATALSLNAFPYLATFLVLFRPRVMGVYPSDTYCDS